MAKVTQPHKEHWETNKKSPNMVISERKIGPNPPTHDVRWVSNIRNNKKHK